MCRVGDVRQCCVVVVKVVERCLFDVGVGQRNSCGGVIA